jgi:hypothetical protein
VNFVVSVLNQLKNYVPRFFRLRQSTEMNI